MTHPTPWKASMSQVLARPVWFVTDATNKRVCICVSAVAADVMVQMANRYTIAQEALQRELDDTRDAAARVKRLADALERDA
jgi:hypothetical protein